MKLLNEGTSRRDAFQRQSTCSTQMMSESFTTRVEDDVVSLGSAYREFYKDLPEQIISEARQSETPCLDHSSISTLEMSPCSTPSRMSVPLEITKVTKLPQATSRDNGQDDINGHSEKTTATKRTKKYVEGTACSVLLVTVN